MKKDEGGFHIVAGVIIFLFAVVITATDFNNFLSDQWQMLARSFLAGKTFFLQTPNTLNDSVFWQGHYYWPFPPFPAVFFMPFVFVGDRLHVAIAQGYIQVAVVVLAFYLIYRLARKFFSVDDSLYMAIAFSFASAFLWIIAIPAYTHMSYLLAVTALFGALLEYTGRKRWWLIGILMGIALASRTTSGLGILFFLGDIFIVQKHGFKKKLRAAVGLLTPFVLAGMLLALYNYVRFGSPFETGYAIQILTQVAFEKARSYGLFSLAHIPGNLYYFLLAAPVPILKDGVSRVLAFPYIKADAWGMGIFFVSPYLLYLFRLSYRDTVSRLIIATCVITAIPIFMYYGVGFSQLGYRYALDFMPFVYFLFMKNYSEQYGALSPRLKWLIAISAFVDLYFFLTIATGTQLP